MSIEIFTDAKFSGKSCSVNYNCAWVGDFWNDKISSIKIHSGTWEFFENAKFQGRSFRLGPGNYSWVGDARNDMISSFKQVGGNELVASSQPCTIDPINGQAYTALSFNELFA